jgi:Tfp pilus assembly protein PilN
MLNLLQKKEQKKIYQEYRLRRLVVSLALVTFVGVFLLVLLLPSLILSLARKDEAVRDLSALQDKSAKDAKDLETSLSQTNQRLQALQKDKTTSAHDIFISIMNDTPPGVRLTGFTYQYPTETKAAQPQQLQITITGRSANRDALQTFARDLESADIFEDVTLPVSNFAKDKDIDFILNLLIKTNS